MAQGTLRINTENILPIIKKWLYSDKDIFLRELVSNACDACTKAKILAREKELEAVDTDFRIDINIDKGAKTITISDTGIGMTSTEVEKYIAEVAFSGAEEFLQKYQSQTEQIIGHFGLGFYSAYMVSEKVDIETFSYQKDASPVLWSSNGHSEYSIENGSKKERGTQITLHIEKDSLEFLDEPKIRHILEKYCSFLPFPIYLNGSLINKKNPLWTKSPNDCQDADYLEFYRQLYPLEQDPVFWIHLNVDYPFNLKGILYFPKIHRKFEYDKNNVRLFCNQVFVHENCKDILPEYLTVLRGALDSPDIPLNVSRSTLQMSSTVKQLGQHISKKIADRLHSLYTSDFERFTQIWQDVEILLKLGSMHDEKFFERVKNLIIWKNTDNAWTNLEQYLSRNSNKKVFYTTSENLPILNLYKAQNIEVLLSSSPVDSTLMNYLEDKEQNLNFQRVDSKIEDILIDKTREKTLLDQDGKCESFKMAEFFQNQLSDVPVEAKSLITNDLHSLVLIDELAQRFQAYLHLSGQSLPETTKKTFIINTNSPVINSIYGLQNKNLPLAQKLIQHLYELSLISQKEFESKDLINFTERSNQIIESLLTN